MNQFLPRHRLDRLLLLLLPILPAIAAFWLLKADAGAFIAWWATLTISGLLFLPLSGRIFSQSPDRGYLFAKPLSLLLSGLAVWTLSYLHLLPFHPIVIYAVILFGAVLIHMPAANRDFWAKIPSQPGVLEFWAVEESMLGFASLYWTFARGLSPALDSLEKFMDYGFMMTLWRTDFLPAKDMWFAGSSINYYYFGQYLATFWAKAAGVHPEKAYNLAMASMFALTFCLSFSVALLIGALAVRASRRVSRALPVVFAAASAILLTFGGNGHIFYYGSNPIGRWLQAQFSSFGWSVGTISNPYWFADATRFIGYNPETTDKTIHEFPYYSFLVADLHAHVVNLIAVFLLIGLLAVLIARKKNPNDHSSGFSKPQADRSAQLPVLSGLRKFWRKLGLDPLLVLLSVILAVFMMGNYWDFVIYFAVTVMVLLASTPVRRPSCSIIKGLMLMMLQILFLMLPYILIQNVYAAIAAYTVAVVISRLIETRFTHPLTTTGARASELFLLAHLVALPFNARFEPIAKTIARTLSRTPLIQLWILYGFLFLAGAVLVIDLVIEQRNNQIQQISRFDRPRFAASDQSGLQEHYANSLPEASLKTTAISRHAIAAADRLMLIFLICGIGLILIPELVYVVDIYSGEYKRANTMFKFTYQAFILLSFVLSYAPLRLLLMRSQKAAGSLRRKVIGFFLLVLYIPSLLYPISVTTQWLGTFSLARYQGIDGVRPFAKKDSADIPGSGPGELADDYAAIQWFNKTVSGQPVILESFGDSYTDYCRISAYTGLPTVIGWQTHEWLWRTSRATPDAYSSVVIPRQNDVRSLYTSTDPDEVARLIDQYQIRYIVIGDLERQKFSVTDVNGISQTLINENLLHSLGSVAFRSNNLVIIAVSE